MPEDIILIAELETEPVCRMENGHNPVSLKRLSNLPTCTVV